MNYAYVIGHITVKDQEKWAEYRRIFETHVVED